MDEKINDFVKNDSEFFIKILDRKPKVDLGISSFMPPNLAILNNVLKVGSYNYSFIFKKGEEMSECIEPEGMEHIVKRQRPKPPNTITSDDGFTIVEDVIGDLNIIITGRYYSENVVGLFLYKEAMTGSKCDLENLVYTQKLSLTPRLESKLNFSKLNIRGNVFVYASLANRYGEMSDCIGPLEVTYIDSPDDPLIALSKSDDGNLITRSDGQLVFSSEVSVDVTTDYFQTKEKINVYRSPGIVDPAECISSTRISVIDPMLTEVEEEVKTRSHEDSITTSEAEQIYTYSAKITSDVFPEDSACVGASILLDNKKPVLFTALDITPPSPNGCVYSYDVDDDIHYTNCSELSYSFSLNDSGTHQVYGALTTDSSCADVADGELISQSVSDIGVGFSGTIDFNVSSKYYFYVKDALGNSFCEKTNIGQLGIHGQSYRYSEPLPTYTAEMTIEVPDEVQLSPVAGFDEVIKGRVDGTVNAQLVPGNIQASSFDSSSIDRYYKFFSGDGCSGSTYFDSRISTAQVLSSLPHDALGSPFEENIQNNYSVKFYDRYSESNCAKVKYNHDSTGPTFWKYDKFFSSGK